MKKQLFLITGALLALASCSQDETMDVNRGNAIDFRTAVGTRAMEVTNNNITSIFVTALDANNANFFSNLEFKREGTSFNSDKSYYWPVDGSTLSFFAYAPLAEKLGGTLTIDKDTKTLADFSPAPLISDQVDFITAYATGNKENNEGSGVALEFKHRLSQIEIKAKNTNDAYVFKVMGVRIGKPVSKGAFDFVTENWTPGTDKAIYDATTAEKTLGEEAVSLMTAVDDNAMLLPQQLIAWNQAGDKTNEKDGAYLSVKVQITTKDGARVYPLGKDKDYDWAAIPVDTKWEAGMKYVYTLDFSNGAGFVDPEKPSPTDPENPKPDPTDPFEPGDPILGGGDPISFTVTVKPWTDADTPIEM